MVASSFCHDRKFASTVTRELLCLIRRVSLGRARLPVNHHIDSGIMLAIVMIKEISSLFAMGIFNKENSIIMDRSVSRLMFCYHSMIYTALNLNNNFCWDSTSSRWNESEVSSNKSSLEEIAFILVCRLLSADKISFTISHHRSVENSLNCLFFSGKLKQPVGDLVNTGLSSYQLVHPDTDQTTFLC